MQDHRWHFPTSGGPETGFHGLDPVSMIIGELRAGHEALMHTLMREVSDIKGQLAEGNDVHHDLDKRVSALETKHKETPPALEVWIKYAASVALPLITLWLTGSHEKALQVLKALVEAAGAH